MGLDVTVGYLNEITRDDPSFLPEISAWFDGLNAYLESVGLPPHVEPANCSEKSWQMYGYSGLHYLRRIAAYLDVHGKLPPPGDNNAPDDPMLAEYYNLANLSRGNFFDRLFRRPPKTRTFDHLMQHSDAEGFYLPLDFPDVLIPDEELEIPGQLVGSAVRLKRECERLASELKLPLDLDPEAEEVWEATETQGEGETHWQRYAIESFTCLRLYAACKYSLHTGAAVVFC